MENVISEQQLQSLKIFITQSCTEEAQSYTEKIFFNSLYEIAPVVFIFRIINLLIIFNILEIKIFINKVNKFNKSTPWVR